VLPFEIPISRNTFVTTRVRKYPIFNHPICDTDNKLINWHFMSIDALQKLVSNISRAHLPRLSID